MHVPSAPPTLQSVAPRHRPAATPGPGQAPRIVVDVASIGYLVPTTDFTGRVQSVFARACNVACNDSLLTVAAFHCANGPTMVRLTDGVVDDLRSLFEVGELVARRSGRIRSARAEIALLGATIWRPADLSGAPVGAPLHANLQIAAAALASYRRTHSSVIDRDGATTVAALGEACRVRDGDTAARHVARLVGWGEGLTPAGDDFVVGLLAGLDALGDGGGEQRNHFRDAISAAVEACAPRTTPIAAHYLRLAARGHYDEPLAELRYALLAECDCARVAAALERALAIGATSGADTVSGLLSSLVAWMPSPSPPAQTPS